LYRSLILENKQINHKYGALLSLNTFRFFVCLKAEDNFSTRGVRLELLYDEMSQFVLNLDDDSAKNHQIPWD